MGCELTRAPTHLFFFCLHSSRSTPRRNAAVNASKKLVLPPLNSDDLPVSLEISSDKEDANANGSRRSATQSSKRAGSKPVPKKSDKGKGKVNVVVVSDSDDSDDFDDGTFEAEEDEEEEDEDEADVVDSDDEEVQAAVQLAKALSGKQGRGLARALKAAGGKGKGKGKARTGKSTPRVVIPTKADPKGKGKAKAVEALVIDDSDSEDSSYDIDMEPLNGDAASDATSGSDDEPTSGLSKFAKSAPKIEPRKGITITFKNQKGKGRKLTQVSISFVAFTMLVLTLAFPDL